MSKPIEQEALFELRFWMQILGDHCRFIVEALAESERAEINEAKQLQRLFDDLLAEARQPEAAAAWSALIIRGKEAGERLRAFKLHLLRRHVTESFRFSLPPTFLNHMVNELDEWLRLADCYAQGKRPPRVHPLHHDLLWLLDAAGHAGAIHDRLDHTEKQLKQQSHTFTKEWEAFYLKAIEMAGYLRANVHQFPALSRFHRQIELEMAIFQSFLHELEEMELNNEVLGVLSPLMADHMAREECYYLQKLAETTGEVKPPACDPTKPRTE
ncbi:hypothetical protein B1690_11055 [Geobacillus sp. 46C-IIa]|uniref:DUF2935 domain-containing protein n=1 Tax=Geobacillus sp. 46C-IIa TaxID=1963025 RepID=UPI0009BD7F76|nr:DUF2935 domain-containing protein [Geobacillus sp. 46C-IIa]OQP05997.1 hypothetical protein B1690_11055 [Geobacillus sp. 46C-IIa]QNU28988.1 DUF2935 domain-containing protein [Geobacillus sp. 46C-IIa]